MRTETFDVITTSQLLFISMAEADPDSLTLRARLPTPSTTEPSRQISRESLERIRKPELRKLCQNMGMNNVWVRKDQLINMILQNSQLITESDVASLESAARKTKGTIHIP